MDRRSYACLEIPQRQNCISISNEDHLVFDSLRLAYSQLSGIRDPYVFADQYGDSGIVIKYCEVCYIGRRDSPAAFGIYLKYSDMHIHHCDIHHCGRRGISYNVWENEGATFNNSNILTMGGMFVSEYKAKLAADMWLETKHTEGFEPEMADFLTASLKEIKKIEDEVYK